LNLVVLYTSALDACLGFYESIGLTFVRERHGSGPEHHAAVLGGGAVLELYPARDGRVTGQLRLGLSVVGSPLSVGRHVLTDPDGRVVDVTVVAG
jgi:catechol 2,3-dioxygenase-like lactoylglutathione lyase family enzyme